MIKFKNMRAVAILSLAVASFGVPAHACSLHAGFGGGFGMERFNPFQVESYDDSGSNSWSASLDHQRNMSPMPKTQDTDEETAEEKWSDTPTLEEQEPMIGEAPIGRRDDDSGLDQYSAQEIGRSDEQQSLTSTEIAGPVFDRAMFH